MREGPRPVRDGWLARVADELGVTRVARLTGLDRTGVEVASAVRPDGHVLQVTNGKGATLEDAARGAILEAAELWGAERLDRATTTGPATAEALRARLPDEDAILSPSALDPELAGPPDRLALTWCRGEDLLGAGGTWVPAHALFCPPAGGPLCGPALVRWTSSGMGAHPAPDAALLHALLEAVERDQLARALPDGFTEEALAARMIDPASLARSAPATAALAAGLREKGFGVYLVDCGVGVETDQGSAPDGELDLALPVAGALIVDPHGGAVPVAAGYACRLGADEALRAALLEACQSRATEIHGAREDVLHADRAAASPLGPRCESIRPRRSAARLRGVRAPSPASAVREVLRRLARAGLPHAARFALPSPAGVHVVRVVIPGLRLSGLL